MENKFEQSNISEDVSADYIRHSKAGYKSYIKTLENSPTAPFDKNDQITPDLTEDGIELAKKSALEYFSTLDSSKTELFFVSSNEARAIETANIYREIAKSLNFGVIIPDNSRSDISNKIANGEIRAINTLSLNHPNVLGNSVFSPAKYRVGINFENISKEEMNRYEKAIAIIDADDQGSYAKNYKKHSSEIQSIYPEIKSSHDLYKREFNNMKRLIKFASKKVKESDTKKEVKILAFGHENMLLNGLEEIFHEDEINNCEILKIKIDSQGDIHGEFRGKEEEL